MGWMGRSMVECVYLLTVPLPLSIRRPWPMRSWPISRLLGFVRPMRLGGTWSGWALSWRNASRLVAGAASPLARRRSD